jgi:hypothetical protein
VRPYPELRGEVELKDLQRIRVRREMVGSPKHRNVGESQPVLIMIDPMISPRTRKHPKERHRTTPRALDRPESGHGTHPGAQRAVEQHVHSKEVEAAAAHARAEATFGLPRQDHLHHGVLDRRQRPPHVAAFALQLPQERPQRPATHLPGSSVPARPSPPRPTPLWGGEAAHHHHHRHHHRHHHHHHHRALTR